HITLRAWAAASATAESGTVPVGPRRYSRIPLDCVAIERTTRAPILPQAVAHFRLTQFLCWTREPRRVKPQGRAPADPRPRNDQPPRPGTTVAPPHPRDDPE